MQVNLSDFVDIERVSLSFMNAQTDDLVLVFIKFCYAMRRSQKSTRLLSDNRIS